MSYGYTVGDKISNLSSTIKNSCNEFSTCQIFMCPLISEGLYDPSKEDIMNTMQYCINNEKHFYIHCALDCDISHKKLSMRKRSILYLKQQLDITNKLPCSCVLHMGRGKIETLCDNLEVLIKNNYIKKGNLLLETSAGTVDKNKISIGSKWDDIRNIYECIDNSTDVGICLDTQHLFASGMCDFENHESVCKMFDDINDYTSLIHLNDSKVKYESKRDIHEIIGKGYIWNNSQESLLSLMKIAKDNGTSVITETGDSDSSIKNVLKLIEN